MSFSVIFSTKANEEALEQAVYLEDQRSGYGQKFLDSLKIATNHISKNPERYASTIVRPDLRCVRFAKPFHKSHSVYYKFEENVVRVLCVFPNRRDGKIWQNR